MLFHYVDVYFWPLFFSFYPKKFLKTLSARQIPWKEEMQSVLVCVFAAEGQVPRMLNSGLVLFFSTPYIFHSPLPFLRGFWGEVDVTLISAPLLGMYPCSGFYQEKPVLFCWCPWVVYEYRCVHSLSFRELWLDVRHQFRGNLKSIFQIFLLFLYLFSL